MTLENGNGKSHIINTGDMFKKASDENFEKLINEIREADIEGRTTAGRQAFIQIMGQFKYLWDETDMAWVHPMILFVEIATQIGCYRCENVTQARMEEVSNYFQDVEVFKNHVMKSEKFFDYKELTDEGYQTMINLFLAACLEPLTSDYPNILFTYMICVACADTYNESGITLIKKLRSEYIDFVLLRKEGKVELFTGTI